MMLQNRKHFGPLDLAPIRAMNFCRNVIRMELLAKLVDEIVNCEEVINSDSSTETEKALAKIVKDQLDIQMEEFLGIKTDEEQRTRKDN